MAQAQMEHHVEDDTPGHSFDRVVVFCRAATGNPNEAGSLTVMTRLALQDLSKHHQLSVEGLPEDLSDTMPVEQVSKSRHFNLEKGNMTMNFLALVQTTVTRAQLDTFLRHYNCEYWGNGCVLAVIPDHCATFASVSGQLRPYQYTLEGYERLAAKYDARIFKDFFWKERMAPLWKAINGSWELALIVRSTNSATHPYVYYDPREDEKKALEEKKEKEKEKEEKEKAEQK